MRKYSCLALAFYVLLCPAVHGQASPSDPARMGPSTEQLLALVPDGATWQTLPPELRSRFENRALAYLAQDRRSWGLSGLQGKETLLFYAQTPEMTENIDRVLSITFASVLPDGFKMARDVQNADLKRLLTRLYLAITDDRGYMFFNHPEFKGWDGLPVTEVQLLDHQHVAAMATWQQQTEAGLRKIPDDRLTDQEKRLRLKSYFLTRAGKYFDKPAVAVSGSMNYSGLFKVPFGDGAALLDAYNASMFSEFREVNIGTLDAFMFDYNSEFDQGYLAQQGIPGGLAANILKLGRLYLTRVQALPEKDKRCTIFSPSERQATWDSFTAQLISNADGSETLQSYAKSFDGRATQELAKMRSTGRSTLERLFPDGSSELTIEQRAKVADKLQEEKRPAMMMATLFSALDEVTGNKAASSKVKATLDNLPAVGGNYGSGQPVRDSDKVLIQEMWDKIRAFIKREYSGYRADIASLVPAEPIIVTTGQNTNTLGGKVTLALGSSLKLASFSSTFMHEMKHAIDQNSHAAVEGAAWEGAATSIERQVWPIFIEEAMASQAALLPIARLKTEIDNVRFTATTDATLKILLRESCTDNEPDTIAYARQIVHGYGYDEDDILQLRSRRAHRSTQYLEYDYGLAMYTDLLSYLQDGVGPTPRIDAYLLQACRLASARKDKATVDDLKACIHDRKQ